MQCEHCESDIQSIDEAHSMLIVLQKVQSSGYSFYQCDRGSLVDGHTFQHWNCSKEEMIAGVKECLSDHHMEQLLQCVPESLVRLHKHVLSVGIVCRECQSPLTDTAYRFCLTVATPVNYIADDSHDSLSGWCCSLEHARLQAVSTVEGL